MIFQITTLFVTDIGFDYIAPNPTGDDLTSFFETVVLLSKGEIDSKKVRVEFSLENMDMSGGFQKGATYPQIKEYVQEHSGLACICCFAQYPCKDLVYCFLCKAMPEVIAHRGKVRRFLLQGITEKPAITIVCADFFRSPPQ